MSRRPHQDFQLSTSLAVHAVLAGTTGIFGVRKQLPIPPLLPLLDHTPQVTVVTAIRRELWSPSQRKNLRGWVIWEADMKKMIRIGPNFTIFLLFFGVAAVEAVQTRNWLKAAFWATIGIAFLFMDNPKREAKL
jgi:hypothetical protein